MDSSMVIYTEADVIAIRYDLLVIRHLLSPSQRMFRCSVCTHRRLLDVEDMVHKGTGYRLAD